jgi:hypothetical protein
MHERSAIPMSRMVCNFGGVCALVEAEDEDRNNSTAITACHERSALVGKLTSPSNEISSRSRIAKIRILRKGQFRGRVPKLWKTLTARLMN